MTSDQFLELLPAKPYAADIARFQRILPKEAAITKRLVQFNHPLVVNWVSFDLDQDDSYFVPEERGCPEPHFIAVNRDNGHAHVSYWINPVTLWGSRSSVTNLLADVQHGLCKRLGADVNFSGHLTKNPFCKHWETHWQAVAPYDLSRLADCLDKKDKKRDWKKPVLITGLGRNLDLFNQLRITAYHEVLPFKRAKRPEDDFRAVMESDAVRINDNFTVGLSTNEVKGIAKSVSKWVWKKFSEEKFSEIQSRRAKRPWKKETLVKTKPWEAEGISRSLWYSRRKASTEANSLIWQSSRPEKQRDYNLILPKNTE